MKYLVTFRKRFDEKGRPEDEPRAQVSTVDGVILDEELVEMVEPAGLGVAEDLNDGVGSQESNDNGFLGIGTETWVFDIAEGREKEFTDALSASRVVLEFEEVPDESLTT